MIGGGLGYLKVNVHCKMRSVTGGGVPRFAGADDRGGGCAQQGDYGLRAGGTRGGPALQRSHKGAAPRPGAR